MIAATQNSMRPSRHSRTISAGLISPSTATTTMQPSVACGRSLSTPPRNSAQPTASAAVTSSLSCVRAPALWLIAVWENPPADGIARKNAPAMQATPLAASSWSLSIGGSSRRRTLRATDAVSRKHMMAMAKAPGRARRRGRTTAPRASAARTAPGRSARRRVRRATRRRRATMPSDDGEQRAGHLRDDPADAEQHGERGGREARPWSSSRRRDRRRSRRPRRRSSSAVGSPAMPSSLGSWPAATVRPTPILIPVNVASEMLSIRAPSRSSRAASRITPTSSVSIARSPTGSVPSAATPAASSVEPVSRATVDVVLTDNVREPPSRAYTTIGTMHVYSPTSTGRSAIVA